MMNKANAGGPTYGFWLASTYSRILIANPKITRVKQYGIRCVTGGGGTVTIDNPQIDAMGNYAALPAVSIYGILVESGIACNIIGGNVTNSQGYGVSHQGYGQVIGTQIIDSSLANSSTQGLYALEVAPNSAGAPIVVSGVYLLNNGGPRGTGVRVSNASNVVTFDHVTATGFSTVYDNNGGGGINRALYSCSWSNSLALDAFQALNGLQAGTGTLLTQVVVYSQTITPASTAAASAAEQTFTVTGLTTADKVYLNPPAGANSCTPVSCRVTGANTIGITYMNPTGGALTSASGTYLIVAVRS
jgi:hypothetical protein